MAGGTAHRSNCSHGEHSLELGQHFERRDLDSNNDKIGKQNNESSLISQSEGEAGF